MKLAIILLLFLGFAYQLTLNLVQCRSANNPIPENVADVYDGETYAAWRLLLSMWCWSTAIRRYTSASPK